jgi:23S rRNA 5-hydroxycytidine C2501 synthase
MPVHHVHHNLYCRMNTTNLVELLSPARDLETGIAAINCGADAVYIGAARFGARESAGNPLNDIEALIGYAHRYWARVYVTVNTLLHDEEIEPAVRLIHQLYEAGADAIIIQDVGLLECDLPPVPLFASTQMHNHTPERVAFLEQVGIQRAILARELSLDQIRAIRAATSLELECFIHGALCVGYSGQCYFSYALGGRSGNRGQCAQPCRRLYRLVDRNGAVVRDYRHLLSLRDFNLSGQLQDLLDAGVRSFKIEGRLKDLSYIKNVVAHYRRELDQILSQSPLRASASGNCQVGFAPDPLKTFNRGYTSYFLKGRAPDLTSWDTPKSLGEPLGAVTALNAVRKSIRLNTHATLTPGDGLCFFDSERNLRGTSVHQVMGKDIHLDTLTGLAVGAQIYRNHDHAFTAQVTKDSSSRKIPVWLRLTASETGLVLAAQDSDGVKATAELICEKAAAQKPEAALAAARKQLSKFGGTDFDLVDLEVDLQEMVFVPVASWNTLRREVLENLASEREKQRPRLTGETRLNSAPFPARELSFEGNVLNQKSRDFYHRHGVEKIEPAAESGLSLRGRRVMTSRYCIKYQLNACPRMAQPGRAVPKLNEPLTLIDEQNNRFPLRFDCANCQMEVFFQDASPSPARTSG